MAPATLEVEGSTGPSTSPTKACSKCGQVSSLDDFYLNPKTLSGRASWCRPCTHAANRAYGATPEGRRTRRDGHLRRTFGITLAEFDAMLCYQKGLCAICERPPKSGQNLHVDHDHRTGDVRGLLCRPCNTGIGLLQESPTLFAAATTYLANPA